MSVEGTQLIFSELLERHGHIRVPLIQRDFAQGRTDQQEVRDEFLGALHQALCLPPASELLPLNLDFIYGSVEGEGTGNFQPLDGQQRLTTLFLLHWYLAWRDDCGEAFRMLCADGKISRFSYRVRPSSKEFFDALVLFSPPKAPDEVDNVSLLLADQPWYFRGWRLDPTIQSALVMLDALHNRFQNEHGLYARLTDTVQPAITFQLLDLRNFGLSDDLYIKMNARGKPLTPFETFKARYEQILSELFPEETRLLNGQKVGISEFFSRRMDTQWSDFFWPHRDKDSHVFDAAVMNVFRAVILITRLPQSEDFIESITRVRNRFTKNSYAFFHQGEWLDVAFSEALITLLENWSDGGKGFSRQLPDNRYFDEEVIFEKILSEPELLGYEEIVQFSAYLQFLKVYAGRVDSAIFQEWMRVVFNLSVNTEYNRPADLQRSFSAIVDLMPNMTTILDYLAQPDTKISGFNLQQIAEEQLKARLLLADKGWWPLLDEAEKHRYFRGQVGFLLHFCGVSTHPAAKGDVKWEASQMPGLQETFSDYLKKATAMFDNNGLHKLPGYRWERALLAVGDYLFPDRLNHSLLVNSQSGTSSWKLLLRTAGAGSAQGEVLHGLWDKLSNAQDLSVQLDGVIDGASDDDPWRAALIKTPAAIEYCSRRMIRRADNGLIYLLSKSQMNGAHAELFTYSLYHRVLIPAKKNGDLKLVMHSYWEVNTSEEEPGIKLTGRFGGQPLSFFIEFHNNHYLITLSISQPLSSLHSTLIQKLGFALSEQNFIKNCQQGDIENVIFEIDQYLAKTGDGHG